MTEKPKAKGSWGVRFFIFVLGITLGILFFWLLNFLERDIGKIKSPDWEKVRAEFVDESLDEQQKTLNKDISVLLDNTLSKQSFYIHYCNFLDIGNILNEFYNISGELRVKAAGAVFVQNKIVWREGSAKDEFQYFSIHDRACRFHEIEDQWCITTFAGMHVADSRICTNH